MNPFKKLAIGFIVIGALLITLQNLALLLCIKEDLKDDTRTLKQMNLDKDSVLVATDAVKDSNSSHIPDTLK